MSEQRIAVGYPKTDVRLLSIEAYHSPGMLTGNTHTDIKSMLNNDYKDFLNAPTLSNLHCVVSQLLSYQDSFLMGVRRKAQ